MPAPLLLGDVLPTGDLRRRASVLLVPVDDLTYRSEAKARARRAQLVFKDGPA